jgi:hypothetical protein
MVAKCKTLNEIDAIFHAHFSNFSNKLMFLNFSDVEVISKTSILDIEKFKKWL